MPQNNQDDLFNDQPYDQQYGGEDQMDYSAFEGSEEDESSEDFPEPAAKPAKKKPSVALIGGAVIGAAALGLGGMYFVMPESLAEMLGPDVVAMMPEGTFPEAAPAEEIPADPIVPKRRKRNAAAATATSDQAAVPPADQPAATENPSQPADQAAPAAQPDGNSAEFQADKPAAKPKPHHDAAAKPKAKPEAAPEAAAKPKAKPAAVAEAPAAKPTPMAKPKPKAKPAVVAEAPKPKAKKMAAVPSGGTQVLQATAIAFAPHSYWVAAAEVEKLWSISAKAGANGGHFVVTAHPGAASDEGELTRQRTEKLVEMLRKNNRPFGHDVEVRTGAPVAGSTGHVSVSFVKQL